MPDSTDTPRSSRYTPWAQEQIEFLISQILPGSTKAEFLKWVEEAWEKMYESYQDFLSMPDD